MSLPGTDQPAAAATAAATGTPADAPYNGTAPWFHHACVAAAVLGPVALLLPPRGMSVRSLLLAGGAALGTNQLMYDYSGQTIAGRFNTRMGRMTADFDLPEPARQRQAAMRAERERRAAAAAAGEAAGGAGGAAATSTSGGDQQQDWMKERLRKEREVLEAGGGYWELIVGQIGEVWTELRGKGGGEEKKK